MFDEGSGRHTLPWPYIWADHYWPMNKIYLLLFLLYKRTFISVETSAFSPQEHHLGIPCHLRGMLQVELEAGTVHCSRGLQPTLAAHSNLRGLYTKQNLLLFCVLICWKDQVPGEHLGGQKPSGWSFRINFVNWINLFSVVESSWTPSPGY